MEERKTEKNQQLQRQKLLLHSCCGPCSTAVIERVAKEYDVTLFFYNPNVTEPEEYKRRLEAQKKVILKYNEGNPQGIVSFLEGNYDVQRFYDAIEGLEAEPEGGARCTECFRLRLGEAAEKARELKIQLFGTTLSVSPHKSYPLICEIAALLESKELSFLRQDYKKKAGFQRSVELSKAYGLYRQNYCGCQFSKWER